MDKANQEKWDSAIDFYDLIGGFGPERRWKAHKLRLFSNTVVDSLDPHCTQRLDSEEWY